jgi:dTDP-4-dehydrorhamnose reductase
MKLAWITGADGLIGNALRSQAAQYAPEWTVRGVTRRDFDLTDHQAMEHAFLAERPRLVIHCAAMSKSPACQADPSLARRVNVEASARLAGLAFEIPFLFFSTDLVFDGRRGDYDESAGINPLSVYAETKAAAEQLILANPKHTVIRTSINGGTSPAGDRGFNEELRRQGRTMTLFTDEFRSPIPAVVTSRAVWELVEKNQPGLYHIAGGQRLSRWEIGRLLASRWPELNPQIQPGLLKDYRGAPRSPDTSLNCAKVEGLLSFRLPGLEEWLTAHPTEVF